MTGSGRILVFVGVVTLACKRTAPPSSDPPPPVVTSVLPVPPAAPSGVAPVSAFLDASSLEGTATPYERALAYEANGQYWLGRLVLEKQALSESGTKAEVELLARLCHTQEDDACVDACARRLGRRLRFDGGSSRSASALEAGPHQEPTTDAARARDLILKRRTKEARAILEPKLIDGRASSEEIRLLRGLCKEEGDRMCVALCDSKLP
jgi:hypothetical protein